MENLKDLRIYKKDFFHPVKREIANLSHQLEYKLNNPDSPRKLITDQEVYDKLRGIVNLIEFI